MIARYIVILTFVLISSCKREETYIQKELKTFDLPVPVDTKTKEVSIQNRQTYRVGDLYASNEFKGARLNGFYKQNDSIFAEITPEITPVNDSPWYAFKLWNETPIEEAIYLKYKNGTHRYFPKISYDFKTWKALDSSKVQILDTVTVKLQLKIDESPVYVAAQPVQSSEIVNSWMEEKSSLMNVNVKSIGKSAGGKNISRLEIGNTIHNPTICIIGRQHPPEVTGWFAQKEFVDFLLKDYDLNKAFLKEFNVIVYPLLNPDGVDEGHWRTGLGGVDLNRDWAYYHQLETKQTAASVVEYANDYKSEVILGVDFHSTYYDVFYENHDPSFNLTLPNFKSEWIKAIMESMPHEEFKVSEIEMGKPISMDWFSRQFGAAGVTYEIGDNTTKGNIKLKAENAVTSMMMLLLKWKHEQN